MYVEAIVTLMRMSEQSEGVVANLARMILELVEALRDADHRAGLAEAALEAERAKTEAVSAAIERLRAAEAKLSVPDVLRELTNVVT